MSKTYCTITIDGQDVSSNILPSLLDLTVTDKAGSSSDTCEIKLDDTDGRLLLPRDGVKIEVLLGNSGGVQKVFSGTVDEVRSSRSRSDGQTLSISAKGVDTKGKAKQQQSKHWDDKTVEEILKEAGADAGITSVKVDPDIGKTKREYTAMQGESFLHFGERMARENGGTFKIQGDKAIVVKRGGGTSASGAPLPPVTAADGVNLISWEISPSMGRPRFKKVKVRHYDKKTAVTKTEEVEIDDSDAEAEFTSRYTAADQDEAKSIANSAKTESERGKGGGTITIDGDAGPQPGATVTLKGARPGIDGEYEIETVTQNLSTGSGWTTKLELKKPQGSAGKDSRASKTPKTKKTGGGKDVAQEILNEAGSGGGRVAGPV